MSRIFATFVALLRNSVFAFVSAHKISSWLRLRRLCDLLFNSKVWPCSGPFSRLYIFNPGRTKIWRHPAR
jgi:hypothetical protein